LTDRLRGLCGYYTGMSTQVSGTEFVLFGLRLNGIINADFFRSNKIKVTFETDIDLKLTHTHIVCCSDVGC